MICLRGVNIVKKEVGLKESLVVPHISVNVDLVYKDIEAFV